MSPAIFIAPGAPAATARTRKPCASSSSAILFTSGATAPAAFACVMGTTALKAPLTMRTVAPVASVALASDVLVAGSKGTNFTSFGKSAAVFLADEARIAASTGSCPPSELVSAASPSTWASSKPDMGRTPVTVSEFCVRVPVLSAQRTSIDAASSTAESLVGRTSSFARAFAPIAAARVKVAGSATGIDARIAVSTSGIISLVGIFSIWA